MAIKDSKTIFGDGAGVPGDPNWVPVETTAASGKPAANRGIDFGEAITAGVQNRPAYALALNDEDLDARLAVVEAGGLDVPYRGGVGGGAGSGRVVTKDGGALETQSALTSDYQDDSANAHFRANGLGDTKGASVGFEVRFAIDSSGLEDGAAGFLDARVMSFTSGYTLLSIKEGATLNPGGVAGDQVHLTTAGKQFFFGSPLATSLLLGVDLVYVYSPSASEGLYILDSRVSDTDAKLRTLSGAVPVFAADAVVFISVLRPTFGSFGVKSGAGRAQLLGNKMTRLPGAASALDLVARNGSTTGDLLRFLHGSTAHATIDMLGRLQSSLPPNVLTAEQKNDFGGTRALLTDNSQNTGFNASVVDYGASATVSTRAAAFAAFKPMDLPTDMPDGQFTVNFTAVNGTVTITTTPPPAASLQAHLMRGHFVRITGTASNNGVYRVSSYDGTSLVLQSLADGLAPSPAFPTAGTASGELLFAQIVGFRDSLTVDSPLKSGDGLVNPQNLFTVGEQDSSCAMLLLGGDDTAALDKMYLLRGVSSDTISGLREVFAVGVDGTTRSEGSLISGTDVTAVGNIATSGGFVQSATDVVAAGEFNYLTPKTHARTIPLALATTSFNGVPTGTAYVPEPWVYFNGKWSVQNMTFTGKVYIPIKLPVGAIITLIELMVTQGTATSLSANINKVAHTWGGTPSATLTGDGFAPSGAGAGTRVLNYSVATTIAADADYYVSVTPADITDELLAARITFTDPGPRNY